MAVNNKSKIKFGILAIAICFVVATTLKNWGPAVAKVDVENYTTVVKGFKKQPKVAQKKCPEIIAKLKSGIPDLQKNGFKDKAILSEKLIADCYFYAEDYPKAAEGFRKMVQYEPQVPKWHYKEAQALHKAGKSAEALPIIHLATQLDDNAEIWLLKGEIQTALKLPNNAIESYQQAIKMGNYEQIQKAQTAIQALSTR
jgi:tetratricopeptide (TPR) repeat protein